jgi:DNA-directed RNA polymerase specialized sigma24 family protein
MMEILIGSTGERSEAAIEARLLLEELLGKLLPMEREVYVRHVEGWKHPEIAEELGISLTMSWFRLTCAKKKLASWLPVER